MSDNPNLSLLEAALLRSASGDYRDNNKFDFYGAEGRAAKEKLKDLGFVRTIMDGDVPTTISTTAGDAHLSYLATLDPNRETFVEPEREALYGSLLPDADEPGATRDVLDLDAAMDITAARVRADGSTDNSDDAFAELDVPIPEIKIDPATVVEHDEREGDAGLLAEKANATKANVVDVEVGAGGAQPAKKTGFPNYKEHPVFRVDEAIAGRRPGETIEQYHHRIAQPAESMKDRRVPRYEDDAEREIGDPMRHQIEARESARSTGEALADHMPDTSVPVPGLEMVHNVVMIDTTNWPPYAIATLERMAALHDSKLEPGTLGVHPTEGDTFFEARARATIRGETTRLSDLAELGADVLLEEARPKPASWSEQIAEAVENDPLDALDASYSARPSQARVVIESPYGGNVGRNTTYARAALADCLMRGECPFASHLLYTQVGVLDDSNPIQRGRGILAGFEWQRMADKVVVYDDFGISAGMGLGIANAIATGLPIEYRKLPAAVLRAVEEADAG